MKKRYKFLQTGDLHVGAGRGIWGQEETLRRARFIFRAILETALAEKCDSIIIAGDVFDAKTVPAAERELVVDCLVRISAQVPVYVISGNHDLLSEEESHVNLLHVLSESQRVNNLFVANSHVPSTWQAAKGLKIIGASCGLSESQEWVDKYVSTIKKEDGQHIFVGHAMIRGCAMNDKGRRQKGDDRALTLAGASENEAVVYWCYGDIHARQPLPTLAAGAHGWYAGSPIQINFGEERDRGCLLVTLETNDNEEWAYRGKRYVRLDDKEFSGLSCAPLVQVTRQEQLEDLPPNALLSLGAGLVLSEAQRAQVVKKYKVLVDNTLPTVDLQDVLMGEDGQILAFDPLQSSIAEVEEEVLRDGASLSDVSRQELRKIVGLGIDRFRNRSYLT